MALLGADLMASLSRLRLSFARLAPSRDLGDRRSSKRGSSVEFSDYREYEPGDDFRHIDWNIYARLDRLFVRLFAEEQNQSVTVLLDASASMQTGAPPKIEYGKRVAAAVGFVALWSGDLARLGTAAASLAWQMPRRRGRRQAGELFRTLERLQPRGETRLADALQALGSLREQADAVVLISDLLDPTWPQAIGLLGRRRGASVLIHLLAPEDWDPGYVGEYELVDAETGERLELELDGPVGAAYRRAALEWLTAVRARAHEAGVACFQLDTSLPLENLLLREMRKGGLLR